MIRRRPSRAPKLKKSPKGTELVDKPAGKGFDESLGIHETANEETVRRTPLHIARISDDVPSKIDVIASNEIARGFLDVAIELWRLAGRDERATAIANLITSGYETDPPRLSREHITTLRELLDGLEQALVGTVTDEQHVLSREQIAQLRERAKVVDLDESWGADARYAIQSAVVYVDHLRDILDEALEQDASILFD